MNTKHLLAIGYALGIVATTSVAAAQDEEKGPPGAPPDTPPEAKADVPAAPPPPAATPPATKADVPPAPPPTALKPEDDNDEGEDGPTARETADGVRARGGFDIGGGFATAPQESGVVGGSVNLQARIGVQITHIFGVVYQATPTVLVLVGNSGVAAGGAVFNNIMASFTFGHFFDVMVGPSVDIVAIAACGSACAAGVLVAPGANGRVAFNLGSGPSRDSPGRSGFNIGLDVHPTFIVPGPTILLDVIVGIGGEWF